MEFTLQIIGFCLHILSRSAHEHKITVTHQSCLSLNSLFLDTSANFCIAAKRVERLKIKHRVKPSCQLGYKNHMHIGQIQTQFVIVVPVSADTRKSDNK